MTMEELEFLEKYPVEQRKEFLDEYVQKYKNEADAFYNMSLLKRAYYLWEHREKGMVKLEKLRAKANTIMIPVVIKKKKAEHLRSDNLPDIGELMVKCNNMLAELICIQKEQLSLFKKLANKA
jgi:hypothetical protein